MENNEIAVDSRQVSAHISGAKDPTRITEEQFDQFCDKGDHELLLSVLSPAHSPAPGDRSKSAADGNATRYENSYQMAPKKKFLPDKAQKIIEETLEERLNEVEYSPDVCKALVTELSELIKERIKAMKLPRYKIICIVQIGQRLKQGLRIGSRCIWNTRFDNYATGEFSNPTLFAIGTAYVVYLESINNTIMK